MIPEFTDDATFREILDPAMDIAQRGDRDEAERYVAAYVTHLTGEPHRYTDHEAHQVVKTNVGYYAGYYDSDTQAAVFDVFGAPHPIFGTHRPTPEEAFEAGKAWAAQETQP